MIPINGMDCIYIRLYHIDCDSASQFAVQSLVAVSALARQRYSGTVVQWCSGTVVQWYSGAV
eukprot:5167199-Pyramimonas_sp.AAC.1